MDEMAFYEDMLKRKRMLPQALGMQSPAGVLTQDVQPGQAASVLPRSLEVRRKIAELEGAQAKDDGGMSTLNALAAQFAGESFQPIQAQYLKRAAAASPQARTQAQLARLEKEAEIADRYEGQQALQAERLTSQREMEAERRAAAEERRAAEAQLRRELKSMGGGAQPYYQPFPTAQGVMSFNSRTGRMEPVMGADGKPIIGAAADPSLQGRIAGEKTTAIRAAEQGAEAVAAGKTSDKLLTALTQAETILKQGPTASGVGAVRDAAGRVIGVSSDSAQKAAQLDTLSGWLVANVPRMEGPQSNYDVQVYQTMAGKVDDRTVPIRERLAALEELKSLQTKYKGLNQSAPTAPNGNLSPAEQAELDQLRKSLGRKP